VSPPESEGDTEVASAQGAGSRPPMVAIDLGAGSCRVSLLRWIQGVPDVSVVHRFPNGPVQDGESLRWPLDEILRGVEHGLRLCAGISSEPIASIGVDGWAVDYVRLKDEGQPLAQPFCYRDPRNEAAEAAVHATISESRLYSLTGLQRLRFNTIYQLYADKLAGVPDSMPWLNLPEYVLHRLGARRVSEYTNATHTGLIDLRTRGWSTEIFDVLGFDLSAAPELVAPGTDVGPVQGALAALPAFRNTRLIAPACHDTASAIAAIAHDGDDWAYLSSGTWSLLGTLQKGPLNSEAAYRDNFTNLGAAGGGICFHKSVNGMWLIQQCLEHWERQGQEVKLPELIAAAERIAPPDALLDVDHPDLMLPGDMPGRINARRLDAGIPATSETAASAPVFASLIFHSLAAKYAEVFRELAAVTGKTLRTLHVVGGGGRNSLLNRLTAEATGLKLKPGHVESSTIGNFAIQMAVFNRLGDPETGPSLEQIGRSARDLEAAHYE
jgi:rhamnulokinase